MRKLLLVEILLTISFTSMTEDPAKTYESPVVNYSLPGPSVIRAEDGYFYLYATGDIRNLPTHRSKDLIEWKSVGTAFTNETRPTFEPKGNLWVPDISEIGGKYVLYYPMSCWGDEWTCEIDVATADKPEGLFVDHEMMFRSNEIGVQNSIDLFYIEGGGRKYMFWRSLRGMYGIELTADGLKVKSGADKKQIAGTAYEGTYVHKKNGYYYLFASTGTYYRGLRSMYQTMVGRSSSLWGPYLDEQGGSMLDNSHVVLIHNNRNFVDIEHNAELITDKADNDWILYHGVSVPNPYGRVLLLDRVDWKKGWPVVKSSSTSTESPKPHS